MLPRPGCNARVLATLSLAHLGKTDGMAAFIIVRTAVAVGAFTLLVTGLIAAGCNKPPAAQVSRPTDHAQLIAEAKSELKRLGIETQDKRSDEVLNIAREQRNQLRLTQLKLQ